MLKRCFDLLLLLVAAPFWVPLLCVVAGLVRWKLGSPVLFCQDRPGVSGRLFRLTKFRTMTDARDAEGALLPDADRLPAFGKWLRASSLDELPELLNVLRGEMSLVGPRPLLPEYLPLYTDEQGRRHEVRPGIMGAGAGPKRGELGGAVSYGCVVCGSPITVVGCEGVVDDGLDGGAKGRD